MTCALRALLVVLLAACTGCATLPGSVERTPTAALTDTGGTRLGSGLGPAVAANPGRTGVHALGDARDAFAARVLLARAAERSLDVQYYIWHDDTTGSCCARRCGRRPSAACACGCCSTTTTRAAWTRRSRRSTRTRTSRCGCSIRSPTAACGSASYVIDFARLNRRMHNKSFTADNQARSSAAATSATSTSAPTRRWPSPISTCWPSARWCARSRATFDAYWNSASAYPAASLMRQRAARRRAGARRVGRSSTSSPAAATYLEAVRDSAARAAAARRRAAVRVGRRARLSATTPPRCSKPPERSELHMLPHLLEALGRPARELDLVSPYFVPAQGRHDGAGCARRGAACGCAC